MLVRAVPSGFIFALTALLIQGMAWGQEGERPKIYGSHYGYTFDVAEERNRRDIEMVMLEEPKDPKKPLKEIIFNEKLSKEFQDQYKYRFGQTQAEQIINSPGRFDEYTYYNTQKVTIQDYQIYQKQFAEYMGRRLVEYHVDNWVRSDRDLRPVYEFKDRVSNVNVQVQEYKLNWKYNFAGPSMDLSVDNPYKIETKVRVQMNGIISSPNEVIYTVGYPVSQRVKVTAVYKQINTLYQLVWSRRMTERLSLSLTGSVGAINTGSGSSSSTASSGPNQVGPTQQQSLFLVGLSWAG